MPDTTVRIPSWADPQNASVLDDWWTRAARTLGGWMGAADPASQAMAIGAPLELPGGQPPIKAFHGSPHDFDQFSLGKIGTGEGGQAYGHGLYFAENPAVAAEYRRQLSRPTDVTHTIQFDGKTISGNTPSNQLTPVEHAALSVHYAGGVKQRAIAEAEQNLQYLPQGTPAYEMDKATLDALKSNDFTGRIQPIHGRTYEVNLHVSPDDLLDWDKPLSQQSPKVQEAIKKLGGPDAGPLQQRLDEVVRLKDAKAADRLPNNMMRDEKGWQALANEADVLQAKLANAKSGESFYQSLVQPHGRAGHTEGLASQQLKDAGIKGIQYLDQGSRAAGEGTKNFVIFDDKIIEIAKKYGVALPVAASIYKYQQAQQK